MKFSATILAVVATAFISVEAGSVAGKMGLGVGTNAQRFARGLPPKALRHDSLRFRRALKPRASSTADPHALFAPGGTCGCTYDIYTDTRVTYDASATFIRTSTEASLDACEVACDNEYFCGSATYDSTTQACGLWSGSAVTLSNAGPEFTYINFDANASATTCGVGCTPTE